VTDTVLITGVSGFAGGHLVEYLAPDHHVVGWSRSAPSSEIATAANWEHIDLLDRETVRRRMKALRPAVVYHCAGATQVAQSWKNPSQPLSSNVLATHYLFDAIRRAGAACRVLVTGSGAIYAPSRSPLEEGSPVAPSNPYAVSKLAQEALGLRAGFEDGLDVIVTRSFNHTGPRQTPSFVAPSIARQIALIERGAVEPVIRVGNLDAERDLTDVRDVVRAYVALVKAGRPGTVYNVASGIGHSVRSIIEVLIATAGVQVRMETDPARLRPVDNPILVGDASRLREATGWTPRIPFDRMLGDLLAYWRGVPS
jgi:GDP-4-dehydro-6-deoxy-D-mannose reductase